MHKFVRMTVLFPTPLLQRGIIVVFPLSLAITTDEVQHPWCLSSHGYFLGVLRYNFSIFQSTRRSPIREQCGTITALYLVTLDIDTLGVLYQSIYILLFYKRIQGFSGVMHACMFLSAVDAFLGQSTYIIFHLSSRTFSGSVIEVDAPTVCLLIRLSWLASARYSSFFKLYLNTSDVCFLWLFIRFQSGNSLEGSVLEGPFGAQFL